MCSIQYVLAFTVFFLAVHLCLAATAKSGPWTESDRPAIAAEQGHWQTIVPPRPPLP